MSNLFLLSIYKSCAMCSCNGRRPWRDDGRWTANG